MSSLTINDLVRAAAMLAGTSAVPAVLKCPAAVLDVIKKYAVFETVPGQDNSLYGIRVEVDHALPPGQVKTFNHRGELIETIQL